MKIDLDTISDEEFERLSVERKVKKKERLIEKCKTLRANFVEECKAEGVTLHQVFFNGYENHTFSHNKSPIYKHPTTGKTWSGRGRKPGWLIGKEHLYVVE